MNRLADLYSPSVVEQLAPTTAYPVLPTCAQCGKEAVQRCSRCKSTWYCERQCQVNAWRVGHKSECVPLEAAVSR